MLIKDKDNYGGSIENVNGNGEDIHENERGAQ